MQNYLCTTSPSQCFIFFTGMAYGMLTTLPPIYGLYTSLVPVLIYFFMGSSRFVSLGKEKQYKRECSVCPKIKQTRFFFEWLLVDLARSLRIIYSYLLVFTLVVFRFNPDIMYVYFLLLFIIIYIHQRWYLDNTLVGASYLINWQNQAILAYRF